MTQDIIKMARKAGLSVKDPEWGYTNDHHVAGWVTDLEAFAKLVAEAAAAKEREEFAVHAIDIARRAVAEEREACAKVCESLFDMDDDTCDEAEQCAKAIRARGGEA